MAKIVSGTGPALEEEEEEEEPRLFFFTHLHRMGRPVMAPRVFHAFLVHKPTITPNRVRYSVRIQT